MTTKPRSHRSCDEATPLLATPLKPPPPKDRDIPLGTPRFPHHPNARNAPLWRRLFLCFYDGHRDIESLSDDDVWPLEPRFQSERAAATLKSKIPRRGRLRLLRAVLAVHGRRLLVVTALNAAGVGLTIARLLLLYQFLLCSDMASQSSMLGLLAGVVVVRAAVAWATCHRYVTMDRVQLELYSSLHALIIDRIVREGTATAIYAAPPDGSQRGRKERLGEITKLLANDLVSVGELLYVIFDTWAFALRLLVSLAMLMDVVDITWHTIVIAAGVYAAAMAVEHFIGMPLVSRAEAALTARLNTVHEALKGIQMVKLSSWEDNMEAKIRRVRAEDRNAASRLRILNLVSQQFIDESPLLLASLVFGSMVQVLTSEPVGVDRSSKPLTPARVLVALLLFRDCVRDSGIVKYALMRSLSCVATWNRVENFTLGDASEEHTASSVFSASSTQTLTPSMIVRDDALFELKGVCIIASETIPSSPALLVNVTWSIRKGDLVVIHGPAGVGKSMLLATIRGDSSSVRLLNGESHSLPSDCRIAYCSQDPWLQTLTIRDNILFGTPFDENKYWSVVDACGLLEDLSELPAGDATIVGPRGINLSCGQSARIALARACYADADVYLLDCPLANVDAIVQSEIFRKCIVELLMFKTVVIVTHNPEYIGSSYVDQLVEVKPLAVRVSNRRSRSNSGTLPPNRRLRDRQREVSTRTFGDCSLFLSPSTHVSRRTVQSTTTFDLKVSTETRDRISSVLPVDSVRDYYLGPGSSFSLRLLALGLLILWGAMTLARDIWLMRWAAIVAVPQQRDKVRIVENGIMTYSYLIFACFALCITFRWLIFKLNSISVAHLFMAMTRSLLHAPMTFFYHTPIGETVNRYFDDIALLDERLPLQSGELLLCAASFFGRSFVLWWLLGSMSIVVMVAGYAAVVRTLSLRFRVEIILMRLRVNATLLTFMSEVVDGEPVIRAFGDERAAHVFRSLKAINETCMRMTFLSSMFNSTTILHCTFAATIFVVCLLGLLAWQSLAPGQLAVVLLYILCLQDELVTLFGTGLANTSIALFSIERLRSYEAVKAETDSLSDTSVLVQTGGSWPNTGQIAFENVTFAYTDQASALGTPSVLHNVSFSLCGGEKVGIVGRTGSGKSSLAMALLRVHPLRSGRILVDGVDLRSVSLAQLRRSITMIPQSPPFYRCSIRDYLDPFHEFDDAQLWRELLTVELGGRIQSLEEELLDNGENWSLGQRQLLCFARALLKPSRVLVLDEAFSCVDQSHQEKILRILRERLASSTVVLITHRVDQILGFDRIMVMRGGRLVESGSAVELASDPGSVFYEFLETSLLTF